MAPAASVTGTYGAAGWSSANGLPHAPYGQRGSAGPRPAPAQPPGTVNGHYANGHHAAQRNGHPAPHEAPTSGTYAANNNTAPPTSQLPPVAENVVLHPAVVRPAPAPAQPTGAESVTGRLVEVMPAAPERTVTVEATRETYTYRVPVSEAAIPASLLKAATSGRATLLDAVAEPVLVETPNAALPPPLPPAQSAVVEPQIIVLPDAAAEQSARGERAGWESAHQNGWRNGHDAALTSAAIETDDTRTMALRLRPQSRDG